MKEWLELIGCLQYLQILIENGYDIESIRDLGKSKLKSRRS